MNSKPSPTWRVSFGLKKPWAIPGRYFLDTLMTSCTADNTRTNAVLQEVQHWESSSPSLRNKPRRSHTGPLTPPAGSLPLPSARRHRHRQWSAPAKGEIQWLRARKTLVRFTLVILQFTVNVTFGESECESVLPSWVKGGCTAEGWQSSPGRRTHPSLCTGSLRPKPTHSRMFRWKWRHDGKEWGELERFETSWTNSTRRSVYFSVEIYAVGNNNMLTFALLEETYRWQRFI